jgi:outer membrane protein assembly factor BamB
MSGGRSGGHRLARVALLAAAVLLAGCSRMPWSDGRARLPDPPQPTAKATVRVAWSVRLPAGGHGFAPALAGDSVYAAAADGTLARIETATGRVRWQTQVGRRLVTGAGTDGEIVVVAGRDGSLIAYGAAGRQLWSVPLGAEAASIPAVGQGRVIVRTTDNRITALDAATGQRRWSVSRQAPALVLRQSQAVTIAPGTVYAGLPGGRLIAIGLDSGALLWEAAVSSPRGANEIERIADVLGSPLISGREVCAASYQGRVACFETSSGRASWARDVPAMGGVEVDSRIVAVSDERGQVHAFSRAGASVWRQAALARREPSAPVSVGTHLVVGDVQGQLYLLSRDDGAIAARLPTDGTPVVSQGVRDDRRVVVQTSGGSVVALEVD